MAGRNLTYQFSTVQESEGLFGQKRYTQVMTVLDANRNIVDQVKLGPVSSKSDLKSESNVAINLRKATEDGRFDEGEPVYVRIDGDLYTLSPDGSRKRVNVGGGSLGSSRPSSPSSPSSPDSPVLTSGVVNDNNTGSDNQSNTLNRANVDEVLREFDLLDEDNNGINDSVEAAANIQLDRESNSEFALNRSIEVASDISFKFFSFSGIKEWDSSFVLDYISNRFKIYTNAIKVTDEDFRDSSWLVAVEIGNQSNIVPVNSDVVFENVDLIETPIGNGFILKMTPLRYETLEEQLEDYNSQSTRRNVGQGKTSEYFISLNNRANSETQE